MATTRDSAFKSPFPRLPQEGPSHFLDKLDPWFVGLAQLFKENAPPRVNSPKHIGGAGHGGRGKHPLPVKSAPPAVLPEWPRTVGEMLGLLERWGDPRFAEAVSAMQRGMPREALTLDLDEALPNIISLLKYQKTIPELLQREKRGDRSAGRQVVETEDVYNRWMHDQLPVGGVRFKTNARHNLLMLYGLTGGLERLTTRELTDFFDQFCPCGETHTLEVLRRLRRKLLKVLELGREATGGIAAASP
jgi:hypothetical protein